MTDYSRLAHVHVVECHVMSTHACMWFAVHQDLATLSDPAVHKDSTSSGQNTNAGWFNRYLQTGKSDHETKSNGSI